MLIFPIPFQPLEREQPLYNGLPKCSLNLIDLANYTELAMDSTLMCADSTQKKSGGGEHSIHTTCTYLQEFN